MTANGPDRATIDAVAERLGHPFRDPALVRTALTHPSCAGTTNYQRLEFLGDRVLGLIIARWLYEAFPDEPEGGLNRRFTALVRRETLADIARLLDLAPLVRTAAGTDSDVLTPAVLADVCEALIGALYLDAGLEPAERFVRKAWRDHFSGVEDTSQDAKTALQERAQGRGLPLPRYRLVHQTGPDHAPEFTIRVAVEGLGVAEGKGPSKRAAEQAAAAALLAHLEDGGSRRP
ncbi:MAG: ribonuclease III [Rhodothalassiaceae bacterium]